MKDVTTFADFKKLVETTEPQRPPGVRRGQHAFNMLYRTRPRIANRLRGSIRFDPFHRDDKLPDFWTAVERLWRLTGLR